MTTHPPLSRLFGLCALVFTTAGVATAQDSSVFDAPADAKSILDSYGSFEKAVLGMTRPEWEVVRAWEGFDNERYLQFLHDYHDSFEGERAARKELRLQKVLENDACGCWVEPDETYTTMVPPATGIGGLEPDEMAWANEGGAGWNVDCSSEPIPVSPNTNPWQFELYGDTYSYFYVNSKGQISFGGDVIDWTPTGFPAAEYNQIAGYWQDTDIRSVGEIKWKRTNDAVYVNFIDVGYYNNQSDLKNSFQIIITYPESGVLPDGNNAQVCYLDMNWAHGDVGGSGGCCGTDPGVTGADGESTNPDITASPHVQFGRFNLLDDTYNGPYGTGETEVDGINWLDYKFFNINTAETNNNLNPVPTANLGCDTITLCLGQEFSLDVEFLGPEPTQTVTLEVDDLTGENEIQGFEVTSGSTATFTGTFVANAAGVETVTMVAEDSDGALTTLEIVIEVLNVTPPTISTTTPSGDFGICAGAELEVTANSNGGDEPVLDWGWNLNEQFWTANEATIPFGGTFVVTGTTASGCVVKHPFEVFQTPYYLPEVEGTLQAVCPGESAVVTVVPDEDENFVDYIWVADWNGGGGEVVSDDGISAEVTAGVYQVTVVDEGGCEGKRTFVISGTTSTIPDLTIDAICGEAPFDTVTFSGGYSSPAEGYLQMQLFSSLSGWQGSFLSIDIIHPDSTVTNSVVTLGSGGFQNIQDQPDLALAYGDSISITYVSDNPDNDQYFAFDMFNCVQNCISNPDACNSFTELSSGVVFYGPALCNVEPALGTWTVDGEASDGFSVTDEFNTTWVPEAHGLYDLCFEDADCGVTTCYEVEVNLPPTIELSGDSIAFACDGDGYDIQAIVFDPGDAATINWPFPGNDNVLENEYSWTQYTETTLVVNVQNGCGNASDQVEITASFEPVLDNAFLCAGGTVELDPVAGDQNTDLEYEWTYNGNVVDDVNDNEWEVSETGSYCVTITDGCFPDGESDCAFIDFVAEPDLELIFPGNAITDCDGGLPGIEVGELADLGVDNGFWASNAEYVVTWPDGTVTTADNGDGSPFLGATWDVPEDTLFNGQQICVTVEDIYDCYSLEACGLVFIGDDPVNDPQPTTIETICVESDLVIFDLNANINGPDYFNFSWILEANGMELDLSNQQSIPGVLAISGDDIPDEFFPPSEPTPGVDPANDPFYTGIYGTLTGSFSTPCLPGGLAHEYDVILSQCQIEPVNVFTPPTDPNGSFWIQGLEPWESDGVLVRIFDRWGNKVYENEQYTNATGWRGTGSAEGVYFYTILLPNDEEYTGTVNLFRQN